MSTSPPVWSSDTRISIPEAPTDPVLVPMNGFGVTQWGLVHDLTTTEQEFLRTPSYAPELPTEEVVYGDEDVS